MKPTRRSPPIPTNWDQLGLIPSMKKCAPRSDASEQNPVNPVNPVKTAHFLNTSVNTLNLHQTPVFIGCEHFEHFVPPMLLLHSRITGSQPLTTDHVRHQSAHPLPSPAMEFSWSSHGVQNLQKPQQNASIWSSHGVKSFPLQLHLIVSSVPSLAIPGPHKICQAQSNSVQLSPGQSSGG